MNAMQFKIKKTIKNSHSIKLIRNQSKYDCIVYVSITSIAMRRTKSYLNFKKLILINKKDVDSVKIDNEKNNIWAN